MHCHSIHHVLLTATTHNLYLAKKMNNNCIFIYAVNKQQQLERAKAFMSELLLQSAFCIGQEQKIKFFAHDY